MTVKELLEVNPECDIVEIIVREKGKWVQGYRIGENVQIYPGDQSLSRFDLHTDYAKKMLSIEPGEEKEIEKIGGLKMKIIKKPVSKIPDNVGNLIVQRCQPRHIPQFHGEALFHNEYQLDIVCYPDGFIPEKKEKEKPVELKGQMSIEEIFERESI